MTGAVVGWILAICAALAAGALAFARRALAARAERTESQLETLRADYATLDERFGERSAELRRRGEELGELKRRFEKTKKRAAQEREAHGGEDERRSRLEEDLALRTAEVRELRAELERTQAELVQLSAEVGRLRERPPKRVEVPSPGDADKLRDLERERESTDADLAKQRKALAEVEARNRKLRERLDRHQKLYLVIKGQLEVAKDRIRMLEALRVEHVPAKDAAPPPEESD
jgi:chromosome segregation ATPase